MATQALNIMESVHKSVSPSNENKPSSWTIDVVKWLSVTPSALQVVSHYFSGYVVPGVLGFIFEYWLELTRSFWGYIGGLLEINTNGSEPILDLLTLIILMLLAAVANRRKNRLGETSEFNGSSFIFRRLMCVYYALVITCFVALFSFSAVLDTNIRYIEYRYNEVIYDHDLKLIKARVVNQEGIFIIDVLADERYKVIWDDFHPDDYEMVDGKVYIRPHIFKELREKTLALQFKFMMQTYYEEFTRDLAKVSEDLELVNPVVLYFIVACIFYILCEIYIRKQFNKIPLLRHFVAFLLLNFIIINIFTSSAPDVSAMAISAGFAYKEGFQFYVGIFGALAFMLVVNFFVRSTGKTPLNILIVSCFFILVDRFLTCFESVIQNAV